MKRSRKALATGAAIAAGPNGLRRLLGAALILALVVLLGLTMLAVIGKNAGGHDEPYPCAPAVTTVKFTPDDTPSQVRMMVEEALTAEGRSPKIVDYGDGERPDLVVSWWPTRDPNPPQLQGRALRLESEPTVENVTVALKARLASCEDDSPTSATEAPVPAAPGPQAVTWSSPVTLFGSAIALWWLAGPWMVRGAVKAFSTVRPRRAHREARQHGGAPEMKEVSR